MGGTLVTHKDLDALYARAEIFNKMEETVSLLNEEEAKILTAYAENLLKTRPLRRPESGQTVGSWRERNWTDCEFCAEGHPRIEKNGEFFHEIDRLDSYYFGIAEQTRNCEAAHAQNPTL